VAMVVLIGTACAPPDPPPVLTGVPGPVTARITVSQSRNLDPAVQTAAFAAAADVGAGAALLHGGTLGVTALGRNGGWYVLPPPGAQYPEAAAAADPGSATELYGKPVGRVLGDGQVILSATSAGLFGAAAGDVIQVRRWDNGGVAEFIVGAVMDDAKLPAELVMSTASAGSIGFVRPTSVQIYGYKSDQAVMKALAGHGLARSDVRIGHPGQGGTTPDETLDLSTTKAKLGQFWYIPTGGGNVSIDPAWQQANLVRTAFAGIPIVATCHRTIVPAIQGALNEIAAAGLAGAIDVTNTNRYGGCFAPREVRSDGGTTGGNLSRHAWGMALDMNTASNPMGGVPTMDCRVVWIFRKWGFAWGGNFTTPDGMHFEWVGEDRSQISYPSTYCPNPVAAAAGARAQSELPSSAPSMQEPSEGE
jgi:D-alanyl-D-alanine carboxypeptidase